MMSLCSPHAPEANVRETMLDVQPGSTGVFAGDLNYYGIEHDLRDKAARSIPRNACCMY